MLEQKIHTLPYKYRWHVLSILSACLFMVTVDATILYMAMPTLIVELQLTALQALWVINIYALILSGLLITMGAIGDRKGRKRVLILGLIIFAAASLFVKVVYSPWEMIICRALLGIGGAMMMPSTLAILRNVFTDTHERVVAVSIWVVVTNIGTTIGPVLGGFLVESYSWQSAFLINVPIAFITIVLSIYYIPESRNYTDVPFDLIGMFLSFFGISALIQGIKILPQVGFFSMLSGGMLFVSCVLIMAFILRQLKISHPLLEVRLFLIPSFYLGISISLLAACIISSVLYLSSQSLQLIYGMSPLESGIKVLPLSISSLVTSMMIPSLYRRLPVHIIIILSLILIALPLLSAGMIESDDSFIVIYFSLLGIGSCIAFSAATSMVMSVIAAEKAGSATALEETAYELGNVLGITVTSAIVGSIYSAKVQVPTGVPYSLSKIASTSVQEGVAIALQLPTKLGTVLLGEIKRAFTYAFDINSIIWGTIVIFIILVVCFCKSSYGSLKE